MTLSGLQTNRSHPTNALARQLLTILLGLAVFSASIPITTQPATAATATGPIRIQQEIGTSRMAFDAHTGLLFVATNGNPLQARAQSWVTAIAVRSGTMIRHTPVGLGMPILAIDPQIDRVYVTGVIGLPARTRPPGPRRLDYTTYRLLAIDGTTGTIAATADIGSQGNGIGLDASLGHVFVASGGGGGCTGTTCYTQPSIVTMLDARTLKVLATTLVGNSPQSDLLVDERNHRVYVPTVAGVDVLDARTAKRLLQIPLAVTLHAVDEATSRIILTDQSGDMLLLDGNSSRVVAVLRKSSPVGNGLPWTVLALDQRTGNVYYAAVSNQQRRSGSSGPLQIREADGVTGRILHSCPIAGQPSTVAAAPQSGQVIVTNANTNTATVILMANCRVLQHVHVPSTPINVVVDPVNKLLITESSTPQGSGSTSGNSIAPTNTTVSISAQAAAACTGPTQASPGLCGSLTGIAALSSTVIWAVGTVLNETVLRRSWRTGMAHSGTLWRARIPLGKTII